MGRAAPGRRGILKSAAAAAWSVPARPVRAALPEPFAMTPALVAGAAKEGELRSYTAVDLLWPSSGNAADRYNPRIQAKQRPPQPARPASLELRPIQTGRGYSKTGCMLSKPNDWLTSLSVCIRCMRRLRTRQDEKSFRRSTHKRGILPASNKQARRSRPAMHGIFMLNATLGATGAYAGRSQGLGARAMGHIRMWGGQPRGDPKPFTTYVCFGGSR